MSKSRWHERARLGVAEILRNYGGGSDAAMRKFLRSNRPAAFSSGYPAQVWEYEVNRVTGGLRPVGTSTPLKGEFPMTDEQKAFFSE